MNKTILFATFCIFGFTTLGNTQVPISFRSNALGGIIDDDLDLIYDPIELRFVGRTDTLSGNGIYDIGESFTDFGNGVYDEGEPFIDFGNGVYDEGEVYIDKVEIDNFKANLKTGFQYAINNNMILTFGLDYLVFSDNLNSSNGKSEFKSKIQFKYQF